MAMVPKACKLVMSTSSCESERMPPFDGVGDVAELEVEENFCGRGA